MRTPDQVRDELRESVNESIESIRAIKGDAYAKVVSVAHIQLHVARCFKILAKDVPEPIMEAMLLQYSQMMSLNLKLLRDAYKFTDQELEEIVKWANTLDNRTDGAIKEIFK